jgi:hypothetical protein
MLVAAAMYFLQGATQRTLVAENFLRFSQKESSPGFRFRILLSLVALDQSKGLWGLLVNQQTAESGIRSILRRAPIFSGSFKAAAISSQGDRLAIFDGENVVVRNIPTGAQESKFPASSSDMKTTGQPDNQDNSPVSDPPVVGFLHMPNGDDAPALVRNRQLLVWSGGTLMPFDLDHLLSPEYTAGFHLIELSGNVRVVISSFAGGKFETRVMEIKLNDEAGRISPSIETPAFKIDAPIRFAPTISFDCKLFAFLHSVGTDQELVVGRFSNKAPTSIAIGERRSHDELGSEFIQAIGISNDCRMIAVRLSNNLLQLVPIDVSDGGIQFGIKTRVLVPESATGVVLPLFPRGRPLLAVAVKQQLLRFAWLLPEGVSVVDVPANSSTAQLRADTPLLSGLDNAFRIQFSQSGDVVSVTQQTWGAGAKALFRNWQLTNGERFRDTRDELRREACKVASWETGKAEFTEQEKVFWRSEQPCIPTR